MNNGGSFYHIMRNYDKKVMIARCKNCSYCIIEFDQLGRIKPFASCVDPYYHHNTCLISFSCPSFIPRAGYTIVRNSHQLKLFSDNDVDNLKY